MRTYHRPTNARPWGCGVAAARRDNPRETVGPRAARLLAGRAQGGAARSQAPRSRGAPRGPPVSPLGPVGPGVALLGERSGVGVRDSEGAGTLGVLGAPSSRGSQRSEALSGRGAGVRGSEAPWGPSGEVQGAPSGHSRAPRAPCTPRGCVRGPEPARMESALGSPEDSPSWPFCPRRVPSSWCRAGPGRGCGPARRASPLRSPQLPRAAALLYPQLGAGWVSWPRRGPTGAGRALGNCPVEEEIQIVFPSE